jgi:ABC-2 type transport system permease protein
MASSPMRFVPTALRALFIKELRQMRRDRRLVMALVLPPILQLMLFGTVMSPDVGNLQLGVVDDSRSPQSRGLVAAMSESGSFRLTGLYPSVEALSDEISRGALDAGVVVPADFDRDLVRGRHATVQVLLNAMNANTAAVGQGYIQGIISSYNRSLQIDGIVAEVRPLAGASGRRRGSTMLRPAFLFNPGLISSWFLVTGLLGQLLLMNGIIVSSTTMVKEREVGTLEQLLMTPARISEIIVAKILPPFLLLSIPGLLALAVIRLYFGVPFRGSALLLAVAAAACVLCGIGIGTFVATITRSAQQAQLSSFFIMPPMMSLSGALTPAEAMPGWLRPWTAINPIFHFGVISRGTLIRGSGLEDLWPNLLALLLFALVLMSLSVWRFRQQLS